MSTTRFGRSTVFTLLTLGAGCYAGDGRLLEPGSGSSQSGDVEKQGLTLTVVTDSVLAAALGWESDVVAGAEVIVQRGPDPADRDTVVSDENGVVRLERLLPDRYKVWCWYRLTPDERALAEAAAHDVRLLGTGKRVTVPGQDTLALSADEPGSLVISEAEFVAKRIPGVSDYEFGGYVELYNNSDTTVYLDGKIIGSGYPTAFDHPLNPCDATAWHRVDPEGIWGIFFQAFPGTGLDYPLPARTAVLIAEDAIDHRELHEGTVDLSGADFEFSGSADVDNPNVPNMVDVGLSAAPLGHGSGLNPGGITVLLITEPLDVNSLPRGSFSSGVEIVRIPSGKIIDAAAFVSDRNTVALYGNPECATLIHPDLDRMEGHLIYGEGREDWDLSLQRRVLGGLTGGRRMLQRTRTTAVDFHVAGRTPGTIAGVVTALVDRQNAQGRTRRRTKAGGPHHPS
jgi:hypothetical protein